MTSRREFPEGSFGLHEVFVRLQLRVFSILRFQLRLQAPDSIGDPRVGRTSRVSQVDRCRDPSHTECIDGLHHPIGKTPALVGLSAWHIRHQMDSESPNHDHVPATRRFFRIDVVRIWAAGVECAGELPRNKKFSRHGPSRSRQRRSIPAMARTVSPLHAGSASSWHHIC